MNPLQTLAQRRARRAARHAYFAIDENPRTDTARTTLRHSSDPTERADALGILAYRELNLHRHHDAAFGYTPWPDDTAGDAATGLAHGAMILRLLRAAEQSRATRDDWRTRCAPVAWSRGDLTATERTLAAACGTLLDQIAIGDDATETAALYTRLWIAAYPVIGGQAAEWIASLGNDWQCRAAGVIDDPETVLILPNDRRNAVQYLTATD